MIDSNLFFALVSFYFVMYVTPGPNNAMVLASGLKFGFTKTIPQITFQNYEKGNHFNHEPMRKRKLLLHRAEINRLKGNVEQKGLTLIPLKLYFKRGHAKVEIALAKGKQKYDRRQDIAQRDARRDTERALKERTLERA